LSGNDCLEDLLENQGNFIFFQICKHPVNCRFQLGLCSRPNWGAQCSPRPPSWVLGGPTSKGREIRRGRGGKEKGRGRPSGFTPPRKKCPSYAIRGEGKGNGHGGGRKGER